MNPYYSEWVRLTGGGPNWEFMAWTRKTWVEFERATGIPAKHYNSANFLAWLKAKT